MDDKETKLKMKNEEWMHPWDIQSIINMIYCPEPETESFIKQVKHLIRRGRGR